MARYLRQLILIMGVSWIDYELENLDSKVNVNTYYTVEKLEAMQSAK